VIGTVECPVEAAEEPLQPRGHVQARALLAPNAAQ
jgi:hypothetical protein